MKPLITLLLLFFSHSLFSQYVYTIKADSVKLTGCDSSELIIENHTQGVPGFLYNTGKGRTAFKRPLAKISDTMYTVGADTLRIRYPTAWIQGGNSWGTTGILGTKDKNNLDFYTNNTRVARFDSLGYFLLGFTSNSGYKLDVNGASRVYGYSKVVADDEFTITMNPAYHNGYAPSIDASIIYFGSIYASIGVNKSDLGSIPSGSMIIGGTTPYRVTTVVDYGKNPIFVVDGRGVATINGGYNGILFGSTGQNTDANAFDFPINGGRGTGAGTVGDIIFSTGTAQASGTTMHAMTNRWWIKGGTGYLSNASSPTSTIDVSGTNGYSQLRMRTKYTPSSTSDTNGNTGDFSWDDNYLYIKTSSGWKRSALTTF